MLKSGDIRDLKPKDKPYKVGAGGSLFLLVNPNGAKYWRLKYFMNKKQKTLALGVYPEVTLWQAKADRDEAKELIKRGIDPVTVKHEAKTQMVKEADKPARNKAAFRFSLSQDGVFTIETEKKIIHLSPKETKAIHGFLNAALE